MRLSELIPTLDKVEIQFYNTELFVTIRHTDQVLLRKIRENSASPYNRRRTKDIGELDDDAIVDAYADLVLIDFRGITEDHHDDSDILIKDRRQILYPCTKENKRKLLHSNIDLRQWLIQEAANVRNFIVHDPEEVEADQKKLSSY